MGDLGGDEEHGRGVLAGRDAGAAADALSGVHCQIAVDLWNRDGIGVGCAAGTLRPHLIWGVGDPHLFPRVIERARCGKLRRVGDGRNLIDVVHIENAARAHVLALQRLLANDNALNGQALFITDGQPVACWDWITRILNSANIPVPKHSISYPTAYRLGAVLESLYWTFRIRSEPPMTRFIAAQLALDHYFSIEKARRLISYQPSVDVDAEFAKLNA